jgi:hypothetical protein
MVVAEYWRADLYGDPVKHKYSLPLEPIYWPQDPPSILIRLEGKVDEQTLAEIVERARMLGWGFNPYTRTFYRLD